MKSIIVIPARYQSSRFPGKPLVPVLGIPMIVRVWQQAKLSKAADEVIVTTDHSDIRRVVESAGGKVVMTSPELPSGTDRVHAAIRSIPCDIVVNLQGDEPMINPQHIDRVIKALEEAPEAVVATLATAVTDHHELWNQNAVKVLLDRNQMAIYFSRTPIPSPFDRENCDVSKYLRHIGIYAYRRRFLEAYITCRPAWSELTERLEQLRVLHLGEKITVRQVDQVYPGIDTPGDLKILEKLITENGNV